MKPGRELDALIAEKVMELKDVRRQTQGWHTDQLMHGPVRVGGVASMVPDYSTNIGDAWMVVEKLKNVICSGEGFRPEFELICSEDNIDAQGWQAVFYDRHGSGAWHDYKGRDKEWPHFSAYGETAPHAICLAALKAVGCT